MKRQQSGSIALLMLAAFALSLALNLWLWHAKGEEHDGRVKAEADFTTANANTKACNDSIGELEHQARDREAENAKLRKDAQDRRRHAEQTAQQILATPATTPGNDCKSARDRVVNWLKGRKP